MNIFDIVGPIMVGPSSSHTAGAVRIGYIARKLLGEDVESAEIVLHGSFALTGKGHGTDKALVAGLLGMKSDDVRIPNSFDIATDKGVDFSITTGDLGDVHPNSVLIRLIGKNKRKLEITAASLGGGRMQVNSLDGITVAFCGDYPTLIVHNQDQPGHVAEVTSMLSHKAINIATMQLFRSQRGKDAVMVIECDQEVPDASLSWLAHLEGIVKVTYLSLKEE